jgi:hypothetical protein
MTEHKHAEVLRAIADGKEVEYYRPEYDDWQLMSLYLNPLEYKRLEWRIKPEPKPPIVVEQRYVFCRGTAVDAGKPNIRFTFDPDTKLPIKVELI